MGVCSLYLVCSVFCIDFSYIEKMQGVWGGMDCVACYFLLNLLSWVSLEASGSLFLLSLNYLPLLTVILETESRRLILAESHSDTQEHWHRLRGNVLLFGLSSLPPRFLFYSRLLSCQSQRTDGKYPR